MFLSSLATLNFSLALLVGLLACPLSFVRPSRTVAGRVTCYLLLSAVAPTAVGVWVWGWGGVGEALRVAAFGWDVSGMYTAVVVWCVWWPAWVAGAVVVLARPEEGVGEKVKGA